MNRIILAALLANTSGGGGGGGGTGTVTNVGVATANGLAGTVAFATTTPIITLRTTLTGLIKANGTAFSAITPVASAMLATDGSSVMSFVTTLPAVNTNATIVTNPFTSTLTSLTTALADIFTHASGTGTVTEVTGTNANGFNIIITDENTTPNITLQVPLTGLISADGSSLAAITPAPNAMLATNGSSVMSFVTTLPAVNTGSTLVTNPVTSTTTSINVALAALYAGTPGGGTVTTLSINTANGLAGTVTNPTTTPAVTLTTPLTGLIKANGTAFSAITPAATAILATDSSSVMSFVTSLPAISSGSTLVNNPFTVTVTSLNTALADIFAHGGGGGGVTSFTFNNANGLIGNVTSPTSAPALTLSTAINGLVKANGTGFLVAVSGTDYVIPSGNVATATALQTSRTIFGRSFNGTANVTGIINVQFGGLGVSSLTAYAPICGGTTTTGAIQQVASGTVGQVLTYVSSSALPTWQDPTAIAGGIDPYNATLTYNVGQYISGDGTNGILGAIYVCLQAGTTGPYSPSLWGCESALDIANLPNVNSFSGTYTLPMTISGNQNSFGGYNSGYTPIISGNYNSGYGTFCFYGATQISGSKNAAFGSFAFGSGDLSSGSFNIGCGYGSGFSLSTGNYNVLLGYQSGQDITSGAANIILGSYDGSAGVYNNHFIVANPQTKNKIIDVTATDAAIASNQVLATPITAAGAFSTRSLVPAMNTTAKNALTPEAGWLVFDSTLGKLCVYSGSAWQTITSV